MLFIKDIGSEKGHKIGLYECSFCNKNIIKRKSSVLAGKVKSCGCMTNKIRANNNTKHGLGGTKIYKVWHSMVSRCQNVKSQSYHLYGARGITVCDEWINNVTLFNKWCIETGYQEGLEIDRIDNNGNYEPNNCRWISSKQNARNRRQSKLNQKQVDDIKEMLKNKISQKDISKKFNVDASCISQIKKGKIWG